VNYLEIGVWKGSTFISSLYKNEHVKAYCIDNWSEFDSNKEIFLNNCSLYDIKNFNYFNDDCFKFDKKNIKDKINIYFYDGNHTENSQYKAIEYYYDVLSDEFILIVDDYDFEPVETGTKKIIEDLNLEILFEKRLFSQNYNNTNQTWSLVEWYIYSLFKKK